MDYVNYCEAEVTLLLIGKALSGHTVHALIKYTFNSLSRPVLSVHLLFDFLRYCIVEPKTNFPTGTKKVYLILLTMCIKKTYFSPLCAFHGCQYFGV